ncbi:MAG TPA: hypothetical protein VGQ25_12400 [Gemmatimonadales bacterium]|jgi:hypothetical protein|nr:hypothetical protein [Gemmatimonadales bacterium]
MQLNRILREGFIAGCVGAAAVAAWFLIVDSVNGRPLFTPAMLGRAVFWQQYDPAHVVIDPASIFGYTMIHVSAFVVVGVIAAALAAEVEVAPTTLFFVVVGFCFFEVGFYILVALLAKPLLGSLAWWSVAIGNGLAALGMGYYLWREHPKIGEELRRHPLGETQDGE